MPIVEPEVLMDGDHDIDRCAEVTEWMLKTVFEQLYYQRVALEGMVLKPNMVVPGKKSAKRASVEEVAEKTLRVLKACVPAAVPGIAFLSGGQSDEDATAHLDAMNSWARCRGRCRSPTAARCRRRRRRHGQANPRTSPRRSAPSTIAP